MSSTVAKVCYRRRKILTLEESPKAITTRTIQSYLVVVAPCGLIMFISSGYGGRASDKFITMNSGILDYLRPGDEVMADRGFLIRDLLFERRVKLVLPAFTRGGSQLTEEQVTATCRIANVRIHVERAIRRLKVYKILSHVIPINMTPKIEKN